MADIIVDGMTRVAFVPTISTASTTLIPSAAECTAGTLLQQFLIPTGLTGFESTTAEIDNTSLASVFDTKLPGRQSFSGTMMTFKKQDATDTVFNLLTTPGTNGFIVIRDGIIESQAWAAADKVEVYPVRTATHTMLGRGEANSLLRYQVPVPITGKPNLKAVLT